ncbi:MAG: hypothetical protein IPM15_11970 [Betaproteobacteria bacterium]|nr:hypothetical protein [Betaproteobacteria bacterium]
MKADDRPAFEQRLRAAGQPFESRRRLAGSDAWQLFLTDPDDARVELTFWRAAAHVMRAAAAAAAGGEAAARPAQDPRYVL